MHKFEGPNQDTTSISGRSLAKTSPLPASTVNPEFWNAMGQEIINAVEGAGLTLAASAAADRTARWAQLLQAIKNLADGRIAAATTDALNEGVANLYLTHTRVTLYVYNDILNDSNIQGAIDGRISVLIAALMSGISTDDVPEGSSNLYLTHTRVTLYIYNDILNDSNVQGAIDGRADARIAAGLASGSFVGHIKGQSDSENLGNTSANLIYQVRDGLAHLYTPNIPITPSGSQSGIILNMTGNVDFPSPLHTNTPVVYKSILISVGGTLEFAYASILDGTRININRLSGSFGSGVAVIIYPMTIEFPIT